ncbi:hypothetical protein AX17_001002 [Amanita inopinata Kibby_2008]|nr:hypothetical protein AX17_001002 [Amanita inopinata Kibby_2008]
MSSTPHEIGTLIVVVLKANHLPNKRHIGKQDPYCVVAVNGEKRRTKAIKRGGQHPEWDEEIRFTLFEDTEDTSEQSAQKNSTPPPPPKNVRRPKNIRGGRAMKVACFADDPREPDFIGEADVDLTEVLTKGETDEWFTLTNKDKFAGKVYLELTFWSNEPPPEKRVPKPQKTNKYAGPGYFNPLDDYPNAANANQLRVTSNNPQEQPKMNTDLNPTIIKVPNPRAQSELLYDPPYLQRHRASPLDRISKDFGQLDLWDHHGDSYAPPPSGHFLNPSTSSSFSLGGPQPAHSFDFPSVEQSYAHSHDRSITPQGHMHSYSGATSSSHPPVMQPGYSPSQDTVAATAYQQSVRRSRIPASSSGFVPLNGPTVIGSHPSDPTGFVSHSNAVPHFRQSTPIYTSVLTQAPAPTNPTAYVQDPTSSLFMPPSQLSQQNQFQFPQYATGISLPTPATSYSNPQPPGNLHSQLIPSHTPYANGNAPSLIPDLPLLTSHVPTSHMTNTATSRPLPPQPQAIAGPQQTGLPQSGNTMHQPPASYQPTPPPPPPPPLTINYNTQAYAADGQLSLTPPVPQAEQIPVRSRRRSSLPRPPVNYVQPDRPPPPPLPTNGYIQNQIPLPPPPLQNTVAQPQLGHPGPPPKPPIAVDSQSQWSTQNLQSMQNGYGYM